YHNAVHAADVLQTLHVLLHGAQLHVHYLDPLGLLAAYFAAIIHDYGHPGLTGDFLTATSHPLALRYNDRSPLENHHCAAAFELMKGQPSLDITGGMSPGERAAFRKMVIELVLATDM
ncbi:3'5'-cyclic nucleotide phosphodiesterase, partial [Volvox carteri f. nagariensis]